MKKTVFKILIALTLILVIPVTLVMTGFCLPAQYGDTYYAEIAKMYKRLKTAEGKRIIFVGNSAVAFGVRVDLVESEIPAYKAINFGVYGVVGTKYMLDLSKDNLRKDDIVVVMPEFYAQTCSLYFSALDVWRTVDGDFGMLSGVAAENRESMVGAFPKYVAEKANYSRGDKPATEGAYAASAFTDESGEEVGYMTYDRPYNVMSGGYDPTNLPVMDESVFGAGFIDYLNDYAAYAKKNGATVYFGFAPINSLAASDFTDEKADALYSYLINNLDFDVLGHPAVYKMDYHWFYDNNAHTNSSGAIAYTDILTEDLKLVLGIEEPNAFEVPEMPEIPAYSTVNGDNRDAACFDYEVVDGATERYIKLTGLTEEGRKKSELILPSDYDGVPVREFSPQVFAGNGIIAKIVLQKNVRTIYDGSFAGASRLSSLYFEHDSVIDLSVGVKFLDGADNCYIYIKKGVSTVDCAGGWERYLNRIKYY